MGNEKNRVTDDFNVKMTTEDFEISNFNTHDAFADAYGGESGARYDKVHIRIQKRNMRKSVVSVSGLADDLDLKRICRALKKLFRCNGAVVTDKEHGDVIQLQGDHRQGIADFLAKEEIIEKDLIVMHGF